MARTDALLVIGDILNAKNITAAASGRPVFHGRLVPDAAALAALKSRNVFAFAGIGDPEKFFDTLTQAGITVTQRRAFADHHCFTGEEAAELEMQAEHEGLTLVTTEKDHARMSGDPALATLSARTQVLPVTLVVDQVERLSKLVLDRIRAGRI